jgi:preprotein translocase subunit SecE
LIVAAMIAFGVVLYWFADQIEAWLKRSRDGLES